MIMTFKGADKFVWSLGVSASRIQNYDEIHKNRIKTDKRCGTELKEISGFMKCAFSSNKLK